MNVAIHSGEDPALRLQERGVRSYSYQQSALSRPITTYMILANPASAQIADQLQWQFNIPRTEGLFWTAMGDSAQPYIDVTLTATRVDGTGNGFCRVQPHRMVNRTDTKINNTPVGDLDLYRHVTASMDLQDQSMDYLCTEGSTFGVDVIPSAQTYTPFGSCTTLVRGADRLDYTATQLVSGAGATGSVAVPTASSTCSGLLNSALKYGVPTRFRIPLKYFLSGPHVDVDNLLPLASLSTINLYLNATNLWATDIPYYPATPNSAPIASTASAVNISYSDVRLYYHTVNAYGWLATEAARKLRDGEWQMRSIVDKLVNITTFFPPNGTQGSSSIQFNQFPYSVKSLECVLVDPLAEADVSVGDKSTFLDHGLTEYQWLMNNNLRVPINPVQCGYQTSAANSTNQVDGYAYYSDFRRSKMSQNRNYALLNASGVINRFNYDGQGHAYYNPSTYDLTPLPGFYPSVLPTISGLTGGGGITGINDVKTNCSRMFRMVADLNSVSESDDFISGLNCQQVYLNWKCNGLRGFYVTNTNPGVITYSTQYQAYCRARCNVIYYIGEDAMVVLDKSDMLYRRA